MIGGVLMAWGIGLLLGTVAVLAHMMTAGGDS